ncbi:DUF5991 domain-containing protein [Lachnospiraceae bacterium OttesenSCG-928-D06]|nr:DUF5991 domain-containing protein [Lachnospiraceae bacterium OttesenSCG-928-D06]
MKRKSLFGLLIVIVSVSCLIYIFTNRSDFWVGNYTFYEFAPPNQNMRYLITIEDEDDLFAYVKIDGFQTIMRMKAKVLINDDEIMLEFYEHYFDEEGNTSIWEVYSKGDILLTLKVQDDILFTEWGKIQPLMTANEKPGQYFTKVIE